MPVHNNYYMKYLRYRDFSRKGIASKSEFADMYVIILFTSIHQLMCAYFDLSIVDTRARSGNSQPWSLPIDRIIPKTEFQRKALHCANEFQDLQKIYLNAIRISFLITENEIPRAEACAVAVEEMLLTTFNAPTP